MMNFRKLSEQQNQLYNFIDDLLWEEWDPIGINDIPEARDEYSSYTPQIFSLAIHGASHEDIVEKLRRIEINWMGLVSNAERNMKLATKILQAALDFKPMLSIPTNLPQKLVGLLGSPYPSRQQR